MPTDTPTAPEMPAPLPEAERRLWFDYVTKLNDRALQASRASGITPWALLALAAAIVYRFAPQVPAFFSAPSAVRTGFAILMLEVDSVFHLCAAGIFLISYSFPDPEARLIPELTRRARQVTIWIARAAVVALIPAHFILSFALHAPQFVRWAIAVLGVYWLLNLILGVRKDVKKGRRAKELKLPIPKFSVARIASGPASLAAAALLLPIGVAAAAALVDLVRALQGRSLPWLVLLAGPTAVFCLERVAKPCTRG